MSPGLFPALTKASSWIFLPGAGRYLWRASRFTSSQTGRFLIRKPDGTLWACCDNSVTFLPLDSGRLSVLTKKERSAAILVTAVPSVSLSLLSS